MRPSHQQKKMSPTSIEQVRESYLSRIHRVELFKLVADLQYVLVSYLSHLLELK